MDERLLKLIDELSDAEVARLAVRVKEHLDGDPGGGELPAEAASALRAAGGELEAAGPPAADGSPPVAVARTFLRRLVEVDAFNPVIARKLLDTGVRGGGP